MKNKNIIFEELNEISPLLAKIDNSNVYSVLSSYFNELSVEIVKKVKLSEQFNNTAAVTPYNIPTGYFDNLSASIFEKIHLNKEKAGEVFEETQAIAPILNTISKKPVYSIPANFFEERLIPDVEVKKEPKIVSISRWPKILKFSAAAVIILFFGIGLYTVKEKKDAATAATDSKNEVKNLSKEEIVLFLKSNMPNQNVTSASPKKSKNENAIRSSLKKISEKEIQQFLMETGESDDI